jgi:hypothetical protein
VTSEVWIPGLPHKGAFQNPKSGQWGIETAPNISQLVRSASAFLRFFFIFALFSPKLAANVFSQSSQTRIDEFF